MTKTAAAGRKHSGPAKTPKALPPADANKPLLPQQLLALTRLTSSKLAAAARDRLKPGQVYEVDFGVRVTGSIALGHDNAYQSNNVPKSIDLVQALLMQFGPRKRQQIVNELITAGIPRTIAPDEQPVEGLAETAAKLIDGLTTTTKGTRRGNVTGDCEVTLIEWS